MNKIKNKLFRDAISKFTTGITIITLNNENVFTGKTVNSFSSLSLNPPLILFSLDKKSTSLKAYKKSAYLGINILSDKQRNLSEHFSKKNPLWLDTKFFLTKNKTPMIKNSIANLDCKSLKILDGGDHKIFICEILSVKIEKKTKPLIYCNSSYL